MSARVWARQTDRLVAQAVLGSVALTWLVLVGIDAFMSLIGELGDVGKNDYGLGKAVTYILLTVPRRLYEMFGYAALIGGLMGLGALAGSGELTALRAAGLSKLRICASVALALLVLTVAVTAVGETLAPWGDQRAQALQLAAKSNDVTLAKGGSLWARDGDRVVSARRARTLDTPTGTTLELFGVRVFEFDAEGRLATLMLAARATHAGGRWQLHEARRTVFATDHADTTVSPQMDWDSRLDARLLSLSIVRTDYMSTRDLGRTVRTLERNGQLASRYREAYWKRIFYPFSVLVLAFCAMPFAFGALRSGGLAKRLFIGMVLAIGFYFLQSAIVSMGTVYGFHPALANLLPPLILIAAAAAYFRRYG